MSTSADVNFALVTFNGNKSIRGAGMWQTKLKLLDGGGVIAMSSATLSDMTIDGGFNPATGQASLLSCVQANSNTVVQNCRIMNTYGSCLVGVGERIEYRNNRLEKFGDHAVYLLGNLDATAPYAAQTPTANVIVEGNLIFDDPSYHNGPAGGPIRGTVKIRQNVSSARVSNNTIHGDQCVLIDGDTRRADGNPRNITVSNNLIFSTYAGVMVQTFLHEGAGATGVVVTGVDVTGNTIIGSAGTGVYLNVAGATITGNLIKGVAVGITNAESGDAAPWTVIGNTFQGITNTGIYKPGTRSTITANTFISCATVGVSLSYHATVKGNTFVTCGRAVDFRSAVVGNDRSVVAENYFVGNATAVQAISTARRGALINNIFADNTVTFAAEDGAQLNSTFVITGNKVLSGAALPDSGSVNTTTIVPVDAVPKVATLPPAIAILRGRMVRLETAGANDQLLICRRLADGTTFEWATVLA